MPEIPNSYWESEVVGSPLPEVSNAPRSKQYGARWQAAKYCGLSFPPSDIPGEWQHGWNPEYMNWHPEGIVGTDGLSRHHKTKAFQFVARRDQEEALSRFGYTRAVAIGHPIVYVSKPEVERLPNSLLVMPVHSISTTEHQWNFDEYAGIIQKKSADFDHVVVCVSPNCFEKGYWVDAFRKRGFPVISGANFKDKNAYERLAILFQRFEFTTSNGFGSHLAYAQFFESKTSIFGPWPHYRKSDYNKDPIYLRCPELLDFHFAKPGGQRVRDAWPSLFCEPSLGIANQVWAENQLGTQAKKEPAELKKLFGWEQLVGYPTFREKQRSTVKEAFKKLSRAFSRLAEPRHSSEGRTLARLMAGTGGRVMVTLNGKTYSVSNGPQAVREFREYHQKCLAGLLTNPPDAPLMDLVVGDGVALAALRSDHVDREIYFLVVNKADEGTPQSIKKLNLERVFPVYASLPAAENGLKHCCTIVEWLAGYDDALHSQSIGSVGAMRVRLCSGCHARFFNVLEGLLQISMLIIEYVEEGEPNLGSTFTSLSSLGFSVNTKSICLYPCWDNPDLDANITYLSALRLGESQRSKFTFEE
jgi:hypothetical protein